MTYTFLELFRVSNKARFKLKTLGDVIVHFRNGVRYLTKKMQIKKDTQR
jgi:hypothetical protein